jgi:hypothetical protein
MSPSKALKPQTNHHLCRRMDGEGGQRLLNDVVLVHVFTSMLSSHLAGCRLKARSSRQPHRKKDGRGNV